MKYCSRNINISQDEAATYYGSCVHHSNYVWGYNNMKRIAVIGGGITGLSACLTLVKELDKYPTELILYEASNRLGGRVHTIHDPSLDLTVEAGPDSILTRKPASIHLIKSLYLEHEIVHARQSAGNIFIVRDGKLNTIPNGYMGIPCSDTAVESNLLSREGKQRVLAEE